MIQNTTKSLLLLLSWAVLSILGENPPRPFAIRRHILPKDSNTMLLLSRGGGSSYYGEDDYSDHGYSRDGYSQHRQQEPSQYKDDYYRDEQYYPEEENYPSQKRSASSFVPNIIKTGNRKIGLPLLGIGAALTLAGMSLFFNKTLMRLGNLFFVAGVPMTIGPGRTAGYFFQPKKARATACLAVGIFLVFVGHPILGIVLEGFGLLNLFGNMFPVAMAILKTMPVIGPLLKGEAGGRRKASNNSNDRYDDRYDRNDNYNDDRNYYQDDDDNQGYY